MVDVFYVVPYIFVRSVNNCLIKINQQHQLPVLLQTQLILSSKILSLLKNEVAAIALRNHFKVHEESPFETYMRADF